MGFVFDDGPAPFFKRLNINSTAIHFLDIGWFTSPDEIRRQRELSALLDEQERIEKEETLIQRMKVAHPQLFEYIDKNITDHERSITFDKMEVILKANDESKIKDNKHI